MTKIRIAPSVDFASIKFTTQKLMDRIAENIRENIRSHAKAGRDVDGNPHRAYSTAPLRMRTALDKGGKGDNKTAQRKSGLSRDDKAFVNQGGIGEEGTGAFGRRSSTLRTIRSVKVYEPAPPTKDSQGRPQESKFYPGGYRQYKKEVFGSTTVNMKNTGKMLKFIRKSARSAKRAKVFLGRKLEIAAGLRNQRELKRKWWGIGTQKIATLLLIKRNIHFKTRFFGSGRTGRIKK